MSSNRPGDEAGFNWPPQPADLNRIDIVDIATLAGARAGAAPAAPLRRLRRRRSDGRSRPGPGASGPATRSGPWLLLASGVLIGATLPGIVRVHTAELFSQSTGTATRHASALVGTGHEGAALRAMQAVLRGDTASLDRRESLAPESAAPAMHIGQVDLLEPTGVGESLALALPAALPEPPEVKAAVPSSFPRPAARPLPRAARVRTTGDVRVDVRELPVRRVLQAYERAWTRMDTGAARALWPSADASVLQAAFRPVSEQRLQLAACNVGMSGDRALAICLGTLRYRPRDGASGSRVQRGRWEFELQRSPQGWHISTVEHP